MPQVTFLTSLSPEITPLITQFAPTDFEVHIGPHTLPDAEQTSLIENADFLILFPSRVSDAALRAAKQLKLIQLVSAGFDTLNTDLCKELNISIANNGGTNSTDVAEHTIALILGLYRRFLVMDNNVRNDQWRGVDSGLTTYTIDSKTVGVIGLGQIGRRVSKLANAFGANVIYYDPYPASAAIEQEAGVTRVTLDILLQQADVVTLHVPLNDETRNLISNRELELMKSSALLINTCRGPVVDERALTAALTKGQIAGAGLDVLEQEPPNADNPILQLDNVLFTPHTAGVTLDTWARRGEFIFQNIQRVWNGEAPLAQVG